MVSPMPRPPKRNGRDEKSPDGRSSDRTITTPKTRFDDRPSSQPFNGQNSDEGVAREGLKMGGIPEITHPCIATRVPFAYIRRKFMSLNSRTPE